MRISKSILFVGMAAGLLASYIPEPGSTTTATAKPPARSRVSSRNTASSTSQSSNQGTQGTQSAVAPQMWVHGICQQPQLGVALGAAGGRYIVDQRKVPSADTAIQLLHKYNLAHMGLALTLRWEDPNDHSGSVKYDTPPSSQESARMLDILSQVMSSQDAQDMGDKLWVQFFDEVGGGAGTLRQEDDPACYAYATQAAAVVRSKAPQAHIVGPAIWGQSVLLKSNVRGQDLVRRNLMLDAINWTVQNHAAIDVHVYMASGDDARTALTIVKQALSNAGGPDAQMVALEWAPAKYPDQTDLEGAKNAMIDIYRVMADFQMPIVAYGCYWIPQDQPQIFQWDCLADTNGQPHQPFYQTFTDLANGTIGVSGPTAPPSDPALLSSANTSNSRIIRKRSKRRRNR